MSFCSRLLLIACSFVLATALALNTGIAPQTAHAAQSTCDVDSLMTEVMSYSSEEQIQQLLASLPTDCAAQLSSLVYIESDSGTTNAIDQAAVDGNVQARGIVACYEHTHAKTVRNVIGQALYTVNVYLQWCTNEGWVQGPFASSYWVDINNSNWFWNSTEVIRYLQWNGNAMQTWVIAYMEGNWEGSRSTQNSMCGKADGWYSYNNDCS